ncbi:MAG: hypothetical protein ABI627_19515 [Polyangiaceae bacterium]
MEKILRLLFVASTLVSCGGSSGSSGMPSDGGSSASGSASGGASGSSTLGGGGSTLGGGGSSGGYAGRANEAGAGQSGAASGGAVGSGGVPGATMGAVQAIFDDRCVICHDAGKHGLPAYPQLSLIAADAHAALVNAKATEPCGGVLVVPGSPDASYLVRKVTDATPCYGSHMPRVFEVGVAPPLTAEQLGTIRSWVAAGAKP